MKPTLVRITHLFHLCMEIYKNGANQVCSRLNAYRIASSMLLVLPLLPEWFGSFNTYARFIIFRNALQTTVV